MRRLGVSQQRELQHRKPNPTKSAWAICGLDVIGADLAFRFDHRNDLTSSIWTLSFHTTYLLGDGECLFQKSPCEVSEADCALFVVKHVIVDGSVALLLNYIDQVCQRRRNSVNLFQLCDPCLQP